MTIATDIFRKADAEAEQLLGTVRMVVAVVLLCVLAFAANAPNRPQTSALDAQLSLAVAVIGCYFLLGLVTHLVVRTGYYRMWMAWVTGALDVLLILANIWLSLSINGLNSLYALLFPSALVIPAMLALGSLRFRPVIQVVLTGLTGLFLTLIVFSNTAITNPDRMLVRQLETTFGGPPNLIRIVIICATGGIIALAAWRARRLLERVISHAQQRANLTRFLPGGIAADMSDDAITRLRMGRHARLAIMFVDIRQFTKLAEHLSPEETSRLLTRFRSHVLDVAERHHGIVDKFIGDGALIIFGMNEREDEAASQALAGALALLERVQDAEADRAAPDVPAVSIGIGLHLGDVVVGAIGDQRRLEFTVVGDEVNVASRIEQMTKISGYPILASHDVFRAARHSPGSNWHDLGQTALRGRETTVGLWGYRSEAQAIKA
jgi:adenylate cyclase